MRKVIQPDSLFDSSQFGYSQVVSATGARLIFISGQVGWDENGEIVSEDLATQARQALENVRLAITAAGGGIEDLTMLRAFIVNYQPEFVEVLVPVFRDFFADVQPPAQTWLGVQALALPSLKIEIEVQAVLAG